MLSAALIRAGTAERTGGLCRSAGVMFAAAGGR
jgi:hypothetical protein